MKRLFSILLLNSFLSIAFSQSIISKDEVLSSMKRATQFMVEKVSYKGGYLWSYLPDFSRQWGEMEAYNTMIWIQPPGTPTVGNLFLDVYHATGDEYYFKAAMQTATALITAQHPSGGWHYMHDFAGEKSIKKWYKTIGASGWRLEEFQHYYGNATFDDGGTIEAASLLLRLYIDKENQFIKTALDKAIGFILNSQYPNGGWPQRFPKARKHKNKGWRDYTSDITFNDDVAVKNILFLILCYNVFEDEKFLNSIYSAMDNYLEMQQAMPQPGWAMQYSSKGKPASARSYEPVSLSTSTTENNIYQLMYFYSLTGDKKFLHRIPEAIDWLDNLHLPDSLIKNGRTHPSFIEPKTDKALFIHRKGSNSYNGEYYVDYNPKKTLSHYKSTRRINIKQLRKSYNKLVSSNPALVTANSALKTKQEIPKYFSRRSGKIADLNSRYVPYLDASPKNAKEIITKLNSQGYWPTQLIAKTNPYLEKGDKKQVTPGDFSATRVGDIYDTSPYLDKESQVYGISVGVYIKNMNLLIEYLVNLESENKQK